MCGKMKKKNKLGMYKNLALISQVGLNILTPTFLGLYFGSWLDKKFGKNMLFTMVFLIVGVLSGFMNIFKLAGRKKPSDEEKSNKEDENKD